MGSFYATCSITDLSIVDGDKTYVQLILPTWVKNPYSIDGEQVGCGEKGLRVSNDGAMAEFVPFGFPIEGEYADYGDIDEIVENRNVKMLEKFFNVSIEDIISCATDDRWYKHSYKPAILDKKEEEYEGQFKSWTVGDNKMKNIEILKELTITYFKKEHYDFLSEELKGGDDYWMDEVKSRFKEIKGNLKKLRIHNEKNKSKKRIKLEDITEKQIKVYREIFSDEKEMSDEDIKMEYYMMANSKSFNGLGHSFPISSMARVDMYKHLPLTEKDYDNVIKQYAFLINMSSLYKVIRPSYYGSQTDNYALYTLFHRFSMNLAGESNIKMNFQYSLESAMEKLEGFNNEQIDNIYKVIGDGFKSQGLTVEL